MITTTILSLASFIAGFSFCRWLMAKRIVHPPAGEVMIKVKADASQALTEINNLQRKLEKTTRDLNQLKKSV